MGFHNSICKWCSFFAEALRRIEEGAAMIRTKGEPGTGNVASLLLISKK